MHEEQTFLQAIAERPHDESCRLVFADWLEEAGDPRAEFLRVDAELARLPPDDPAADELHLRWRDLRDELPRAWQTLLSRSPVENCGLKLNLSSVRHKALPVTHFGDDPATQLFFPREIGLD